MKFPCSHPPKSPTCPFLFPERGRFPYRIIRKVHFCSALPFLPPSLTPYEHNPDLPSELKDKQAIPSSSAQSNTNSASPKEKQLQILLWVSFAALLHSV